MIPIKNVLDIGLYKRTSHAPDLFESSAARYHWEHYSLATESTIATLIRSFFTLKRLSNFDVIITRDYFSSFGINLRLLVTLCRTKHVTIGLNQSRKLLKTNLRFIDCAIDRIVHRCNRIVVHSRREITLFSELHCIPPTRFVFSLWGFDLPTITPDKFSKWERPYVCLIGRNNRDIDTFAEALEGMDIDGIVITSNDQQLPTDLPRNVTVFRELPQNSTLDCILNASANLILLKDNNRGAGHITTVAAMFAGTPQVFSDVEVIRDYLIDGVTALGTPLGDGRALRGAINALFRQPKLKAELCHNAKLYAERWLTHAAALKRTLAVLDGLWDDKLLCSVDPEWLASFEAEKSNKSARGSDDTGFKIEVGVEPSGPAGR